ncbi:NADP-dependent oxidoreductase domain-containing protein [Schizophyllum amplum]|uniref:NADP-dependent oxidoreductase domain-containing protein n=1 Tax=Schizophyllum amplum TaxID=97359 RepID=A0A550BV55_9AGAR|nr:NADP-dependent oxidoreductase domain-containing protein [Auriculariopsis ampla]TRM58701.1 NADP-dependent oxidoreductase domain-containing protein [Auriculariopsis ampla]
MFDTVTLNDGNIMPTIAYGTGSKWKWKSVVEFVAAAIDCGFSHIDTAQFYETEMDVGQAIRESGLARSQLFVTTKYGQGAVQETFSASLEKLGLKHVDLYLIHSPRLAGEKLLPSIWLEFEKLKASGEAKSIGVSNFEVDHFKILSSVATVTPAVNQIHLHPYNYTEMKPTLDYCAAHNIVVEAYSSLDPITKFPGGPLDEPLAAVASRRNASMVQAVFLWLRAKGVVIVTTSSTRSHMEEYLAVGDLEPLTVDEVAAIDEAGKDGPPALTLAMRARGQWRRIARRDVVLAIVLSVAFLHLLCRVSFMTVP